VLTSEQSVVQAEYRQGFAVQNADGYSLIGVKFIRRRQTEIFRQWF